jgi:hypothetical protein
VPESFPAPFVTTPAHGTLALAPDGSFRYTPRRGFLGRDEFFYRASDGAVRSQRMTVTISVEPGPCRGRRATIFGSDRADTLAGGPRRDVITGLKGGDTLSGLFGRDLICGGPGRDRLLGSKGRDAVFGQSGNDIVYARDGRRDRIDCGPGRRDRAMADRFDRVRRCERLNTKVASYATNVWSLAKPGPDPPFIARRSPRRSTARA